MRNPDALADFVSARMKQLNVAPNDVARLSGNRVSAQTVWNVLNRRIRNIATETLEALAKALQVAADELFTVAYALPRKNENDPNEVRLVIYYRNVPPNTQKDMLDVASTLHRAHAIVPVEKVEKLERIATAKKKKVA